MNTADAILGLRTKMGLTQQQFGRLLGVTAISVGRYEHGREPARGVLQKLADLARKQNIGYLSDFFGVKRQTELLSKIDNLPSTGSARRVASSELTLWSDWLESIVYSAKHLIESLTPDLHSEPTSPEYVRAVLLSILHIATRIGAEVQLHENPAERIKWGELSEQTRALMSKPLDAETLKWVNTTNKEWNKKAAKLWGRPYEEEPAPEASTQPVSEATKPKEEPDNETPKRKKETSRS